MSKKLFLNYFFPVLIKFLGIALGFLFNRLLNSDLDVQSLNKYNLITSYTPIILGLITFGLPDLVQKFYTNHKDTNLLKDFWTSVTVLRILSYFLGVFIILLTYFFYTLKIFDDKIISSIFIVFQANNQEESYQNLLYVLGIFTAQFILIADLNYRSVCSTRDRLWQFNLSDFLSKTILVFLSYFISLIFGFNLQILVLILFFSNFLCFLIDFIWQKDLTAWGKWSSLIFKENISSILFLTFSGFITNLYWTTDRLLLKQFGANDYQINGYSNIYRLFEIATVPGSLIIPILASKLKVFIDERKREKYQVTKFLPFIWSKLNLVLAFGLLVSILFWLFAPLGLRLVEPKMLFFDESMQALPALNLALIIYFGNIFLSNLIVFANGEKYTLYMTILVGILAFYLYFTLIPKFLIYGAAWSTVGFYFFDFLLKLLVVYFLYKKNNNLKFST